MGIVNIVTPPYSSSMPKPYHHGNLPCQIVAVARERLRRSPTTEFSLRELAREAGVSPNAPYRHFKDKDGVVVALVAAGYRELTRIAEVALESVKPLTALAVGYRAFSKGEPSLLALVNREDFGTRSVGSEVVLARDEWFATLVAIVEREAGELPATEAYRRAAGVWSVLLGVVALSDHGGRGLLPEDLLPDAAALARQIARGR